MSVTKGCARKGAEFMSKDRLNSVTLQKPIYLLVKYGKFDKFKCQRNSFGIYVWSS